MVLEYEYGIKCGIIYHIHLPINLYAIREF